MYCTSCNALRVMQDAAVAAVSDCVRLSRTGLREHDRPQGVFLFLGPTGVGKTELTKVCRFTVIL